MRIAVVGDERHKPVFALPGHEEDLQVEWIPQPVPVTGAMAYIDLLFTPGTERIKSLQQLQPAGIIVNAVNTTLDQLPAGFIRFNGWPGFIGRTLAEAAGSDETAKSMAESVFAALGKKTEWVPDIPGLVTARVISMIINEAFFALEENVSGKNEIDTAMKLGTNYPYGPFEWGRLIGLQNIVALLENLSRSNPRYQPSSRLKQEASAE